MTLRSGATKGPGFGVIHEPHPDKSSAQNHDAYVIFLSAKRELADRVAGLDLGANDYVPKPSDGPELAALAVTDPLTKLYNRRFFDQTLAVEFERARRYGRALSLLVIDVDRFKQVNDAFGHPAGDEALRRIAAIMCRSVRKSDTVARFGGEEFAIILPELAPLQTVKVADKLHCEIAETRFEAAGKVFALTVSVGMASFDGSNRPGPEALVETCDRGLYAAKAAGRNRLAADDPGL